MLVLVSKNKFLFLCQITVVDIILHKQGQSPVVAEQDEVLLIYNTQRLLMTWNVLGRIKSSIST